MKFLRDYVNRKHVKNEVNKLGKLWLSGRYGVLYKLDTDTVEPIDNIILHTSSFVLVIMGETLRITYNEYVKTDFIVIDNDWNCIQI